MESSPTISKLVAALAKAQGEIDNALKKSENPGFKRGNDVAKYADLAAIRDAIQDPLSKNGIAYVQCAEGGPDTITMTTTLACGEEWLRSSVVFKPVNTSPHSLGSAITYARRYALAAMVGITQEDDDGNATSGVKPGSGARTQADMDGKKITTIKAAMREWQRNAGTIEAPDPTAAKKHITENIGIINECRKYLPEWWVHETGGVHAYIVNFLAAHNASDMSVPL